MSSKQGDKYFGIVVKKELPLYRGAHRSEISMFMRTSKVLNPYLVASGRGQSDFWIIWVNSLLVGSTVFMGSTASAEPVVGRPGTPAAVAGFDSQITSAAIAIQQLVHPYFVFVLWPVLTYFAARGLFNLSFQSGTYAPVASRTALFIGAAFLIISSPLWIPATWNWWLLWGAVIVVLALALAIANAGSSP